MGQHAGAHQDLKESVFEAIMWRPQMMKQDWIGGQVVYVVDSNDNWEQERENI